MRVLQSEWKADFEFRATGPERGGGNLQIWLAKEGQAKIGTSSIYTVGQFDGLVLVVDMYGGRVRPKRFVPLQESMADPEKHREEASGAS